MKLWNYDYYENMKITGRKCFTFIRTGIFKLLDTDTRYSDENNIVKYCWRNFDLTGVPCVSPKYTKHKIWVHLKFQKMENKMNENILYKTNIYIIHSR